MTAKGSKRGLGRGLSALMADVREPASNSMDDRPGNVSEQVLPIEKLQANPDQPRRRFNRDELEDLANSIREKGVLQPLIVRKTEGKTNSYEIVAGERRWRAAQLANVHEVPAIIRDYSDDEVLEIAIIENIQRSDLNPVEEAAGYRQLMEKFGHTQEKLAESLSKSRSHIANLMRLLQLPGDVLELVQDGRLSAGHARALITAENPSALAKTVITKGLSVRQTEKLVKSPAKRKARRPKTSSKDADTRVLEQDLSAALGMMVVIDHRADGTGQVIIRYKDMEQLDELCQLLGSGG